MFLVNVSEPDLRTFPFHHSRFNVIVMDPDFFLGKDYQLEAYLKIIRRILALLDEYY